MTAIGLAKQGWQVTVFERAATLEPVGAGIILADNAVRALHSLGLVEALMPHARVAALGEGCDGPTDDGCSGCRREQATPPFAASR